MHRTVNVEAEDCLHTNTRTRYARSIDAIAPQSGRYPRPARECDYCPYREVVTVEVIVAVPIELRCPRRHRHLVGDDRDEDGGGSGWS